MKSKETQYTTRQWDAWMERLADNDYLVIDNFISNQLFQRIQHYFQALYEEQEFSKAAIGTQADRQVASTIRGDFIYWLDRQQDHQLAPLFALLDKLVDRLKQNLFLSIADYEFHFAIYPPGTHYEKHIDQFHGKNNRLISVLIYLNEDWKPKNGGELKIYRSDGEELLIAPLAKRLVMFRSDTVEHEVMVTNAPRKSLTGWLLHQPSGLEYLG